MLRRFQFLVVTASCLKIDLAGGPDNLPGAPRTPETSVAGGGSAAPIKTRDDETARDLTGASYLQANVQNRLAEAAIQMDDLANNAPTPAAAGDNNENNEPPH